MSAAPTLTGDAADAVSHRGSHVQIIAAAGSGKTEVVSQRVAALLSEGVAARSVVAFTFTERAAAELKTRIAQRVEERLDRAGLDQLTGLYVGTIHGYCFQLLQRHVPRFETFDVLDQNRLTAFLSREAQRLGIRQFDPLGRNRLYASIETFVHSVEVVENELLDVTQLPEPFLSVLAQYYDTLDRYRLLTFGQQVMQAVAALTDPHVAETVHGELRHLIVDEYQDVNPAQETFIRLLAGPGAELCVVGDDDQAVYQWRGSDVGNIVQFTKRYANVRSFSITTNRRSRPSIIDTANQFATTISGRLDKNMQPHRDARPREIVAWASPDEEQEAGWIAEMICRLNESGVAYRDIGVLVRSRAAYKRLLESFSTFDIPVQPGGRTGLFDQPEAGVLGRTYAWLVDIDWRDGPWATNETIAKDALVQLYVDLFNLDPRRRRALSQLLDEWKEAVPQESRRSDLVGDYYELLDVLDVRHLDLDDPLQRNVVGTLARFSEVLTDYESVRRRARPDPAAAGEQVGGTDRGVWHYKNLAVHLTNYANGAYEAFDGEPDVRLDAVDIITVHAAKGLEWPVVFLPSMTAKRFPTARMGQGSACLVPDTMYNSARYAGTDDDERRLFYVAMTRARDWLSVSRHDRVTKQSVAPSPYFNELRAHHIAVDDVVIPAIDAASSGDDATIELSYSELASYLDCAMAFRLRTRMGFQPRLAPELGYGKAVHHVMRMIAEHTAAHHRVPTAPEIDAILDRSFFLPTANKVVHGELKRAARRLVNTYVEQHADDLYRVWETERPFELHLDGITLAGRADVILDHEGGVATSLAIVDYKTSIRDKDSSRDLQLRVYTDAGRREGLDVRAAYIHDMKLDNREAIDISAGKVDAAARYVLDAAEGLRQHNFEATPGPRCRTCEVRAVCASSPR